MSGTKGRNQKECDIASVRNPTVKTVLNPPSKMLIKCDDDAGSRKLGPR